MKEDVASYDPYWNTPKERMRRKVKALKRWLGMKSHTAFYRTLFFLGIGWQFNKFMCRIGKYRKFSDGRCMYCGNNHK